MKRLVLPDQYRGSPSWVLQGNEFHHVIRVLRRRIGDHVPAIDSTGQRVILHIESIEATSCHVRVEVEQGTQSDPHPTGHIRITLIQCLPKGRKMDLIVRQATETGVSTIVPILSEYTVPTLKGDASEKKRERWLRIAKQAMQQSGNPILPEIRVPTPFGELEFFWRQLCKEHPTAVGVFFHQDALDGRGLHSYLNPCRGEENPRVAVCIGPEGGFSSSEIKKLLNIGFHPVYIKTNVFRTETAALYAVAAIQTVLLEKNLWSVPE